MFAMVRRFGRPSRRMLLAVLPLLLGSQLLVSCGFEEPPLQPITVENLNRVEIPPIKGITASMDQMIVDPTTQLLYVADGTDPDHQGVDIVDVSTLPGRYLRYAPTDDVTNGLALVPDLRRVYVGVDNGTVEAIDSDPSSPTFGKIVDTLSPKGSTSVDLLAYDPVDQKLFANSPDAGFVSVIDVRPGSRTLNTIVATIPNLNQIDQPMYDPADGMLYEAAVDDNGLIKINPRTDTVVARYPFGVICTPHGMAVNPSTNQGIIGCADKDEPVTIAWDFTHERVIRYFDLAGAGDLVMYDAKTDRFLFAAANFAPSEMAIFSGASPISFLTAVPTSHKSHDVAYDDVHDVIYTYDGRVREGGLWEFPDPAAHCDATLTKCTSLS
jgi:DNA-binding beta-propeller fold protein YncE